MTNNAQRWRDELRMAEHRPVKLQAAYERQAYRIALAVEEFLAHYKAMPAPRSYEIAWAMTLLEVIAQGRGPDDK